MTTKQKDVRLSIRIDPILKHAGQRVANEMGIDLTTAVKMFITQMVKDNRLPFEPTNLPVDTEKALKELKHEDQYPTYDVSSKMWADLDA